jgi:hypothetical protein
MYRPRRAAPPPPEAPDWVTVLYHGSHGSAQPGEGAAMAAALAAIDQQPTGQSDIAFRAEPPIDDVPRGVPNAGGNGSKNGHGGERGGGENDVHPVGQAPPADAGELERALAGALAEAIGRLRPGTSVAIRQVGDDYRIEVHASSDAVAPS